MRLVINDKQYVVLGLDYETFYSTDYSLKKDLNIPEYVHDVRFKAHGAAIFDDNECYSWVSGNKLQALVDSVPDWSTIALVGHNTAFDAYILKHRYGVVAGFYLDTLSMSRLVYGTICKHDLDALALRCGLPGKVLKNNLENVKGVVDLTSEQEQHLGLYAIDDIHDTVEAFKCMYIHVPDRELLLIDATIRMAVDSKVFIDEAMIQEEIEQVQVRKTAKLLMTDQLADSFMSNNKFADLLRANGVEPPMKINTKGVLTYAFSKTDEEFKALLSHTDERVVLLVETRLLLKSTQAETRAKRFYDNGCNGRKLPMALNYANAKTNRWSGGWKLNVQNLKRKSRLRLAIRTDDTHVLVVRDSAQIECRTLAVLAQQQTLVDAFADKVDVYTLMASKVFNKPIAQISSNERFIGKVLILGLGYAMGHKKLQLTLRLALLGGDPVIITDDEAQLYVRMYRQTNFMIANLWNTCDKALRIMSNGGCMEYNGVQFKPDRIVLPSGNAIIYGEIQFNEASMRYYYTNALGVKNYLHGGLITENIVQAIARDIIAEQVVGVITQVIPKYPDTSLVTLTHDEIVVRTLKENAEAVQDKLDRIMGTAPTWFSSIPLASNGGYAVNYSK